MIRDDAHFEEFCANRGRATRSAVWYLEETISDLVDSVLTDERVTLEMTGDIEDLANLGGMSGELIREIINETVDSCEAVIYTYRSEAIIDGYEASSSSDAREDYEEEFGSGPMMPNTPTLACFILEREVTEAVIHTIDEAIDAMTAE